MALTIDDLRPKKFTVTISGIQLKCSPLRLSHALIVAKVGEVLQNPTKKTTEEIKQAETDMDDLILDLIPELGDVKLDIDAFMELLPQLTKSNEPSENKELEEKGVSFDSTDPKVAMKDTRIG